ELELEGTAITDACVKELAALKNLHTLSLAKTKLTNKAAKDLAGMKSLRALKLTDTAVTAAGVKELAALKELHTLYPPEINDEVMEALHKAEMLHTLPNAKVRADGDRAKKASEVGYLALSNSKLTDAGLKYLEPFSSLRSLNLFSVKVGDEGMKSLAKRQ